MTKFFVFAVLAIIAQASSAATSCADASASHLKSSEAPVDRATIIRDMADFFLEVTSIPDAAEKAQRLSDFKTKLAEISATYGPSSKAEIMTAAEARRDQRIQEKDDKELKEKETREVETDRFIMWSRLEELPDTKAVGGFINNNEVYLVHNLKLAVYNIKTKQATPIRATEGIRLDSWTQILSSPHLESVVTVAGEDISIIDTKTGEVRSQHVSTQQKRGFRAAKFSKKGEYLFLACEDGETLIYSMTKQEFVFSKTTHNDPHGHMIVESPDGRYVFVPRSNGQQVLYDLHERNEIVMPNLKAAKIHHTWDGVFSADSKTLTFANNNGILYNFDIATRELRPSQFAGFHVGRDNIFTTLDNRWLVATGALNSNEKLPFHLIDMVTGLEQQTGLKDLKFENPTNVRQAGDFIYFTDTLRELNRPQVLYMYNLNTMTLKTYMLPTDFYIFQFYGFSPDMKSLLVRGRDGPLYRVY